MDRFIRILELHKVLAARRTAISRRQLEERLESNRSTVKRTIEEMRDFLGAPIVYDRTAGGYRYDRESGDHAYEIPGLWLNADELLALATMQKLVGELQPGLLTESFGAFHQRIAAMLKSMGTGSEEVARRVQLLQTEARPANPEDFRKITTALIKRRQLHASYHGRARDAPTERAVSPQRLIHYRDNWYLLGWCHLREELRTFALDRLAVQGTLDAPALEFAEAQLDAQLASSFGIFAGPAAEVAELLFTPNAAKWVADERWHPSQEGERLPDGRYRLRVPYSNPTELVQEILRQGPEVEVVSPPAIRKDVQARLAQAARIYQETEK